MASNEEISQRLRNKREGTPSNYLVCNKCEGYYELQLGESPEHFNLDCECGGRLIQSTTGSLYLSEEEYEDKYNSFIAIAYVFLVLFVPLAFIMSLYLITRDHEWAKHDGKIIFMMSLLIMFLWAIFGAFLIPLGYRH